MFFWGGGDVCIMSMFLILELMWLAFYVIMGREVDVGFEGLWCCGVMVWLACVVACSDYGVVLEWYVRFLLVP